MPLTAQQEALLTRIDIAGRAITDRDRVICPGLHYCPDWGGMLVCDDSTEARKCTCDRNKLCTSGHGES